ncbi:MAG: glutamine amidotransferase [Coriobacteriales bacterium]|jgi:CobQ-like glutamine amidotransferase family enzyme|nr:glutamine amidotransferase [Coriobacteriales bacterium]
MSAQQQLTVLNLYPRQMNIYGDAGNLLVVQRRLEWRGITPRLVRFNPGDEVALLADADIILGGGGQDSGQNLVQSDLLRIAPALKERVEEGVPTLAVCGTYQLFGNYFKTYEGEVLEGIGIFNLHTLGGTERLIGNIVLESTEFGELIGYENHSGKTWLGEGLEPLAQVVSGAGNNGSDGTEGARSHNALGTYLHGPFLPKNPRVADFLIATAFKRRYGEDAELPPLAARRVEDSCGESSNGSFSDGTGSGGAEGQSPEGLKAKQESGERYEEQDDVARYGEQARLVARGRPR